MVAIKLNAGNDRNGNPRRVFVVITNGGIIHDAVEEGYYGTGRLFEKYPSLRGTAITEFLTTPAEYRSLVRGFDQWTEKV